MASNYVHGHTHDYDLGYDLSMIVASSPLVANTPGYGTVFSNQKL
jgi:hypothetical protein